MNTGSRGAKKLGDRLVALTADVLAASVAASSKSTAEAYLRSCVKQGRHQLAQADKWLAQALEKSKEQDS